MFQPEDASNDIVDTELQSIETAFARETLTFFDRIAADDKNPIVDRDNESDYHLFDRMVENNSSPTSSREITIEFLDSRNGEKFDRLVRDVKILAPFKRRLSGNSRSNSPISSMVVMEDEHESSTETVAGEASPLNEVDREHVATITDFPQTTVGTDSTDSARDMDGGTMNEYYRLTDAVSVDVIAHFKRRRCSAELETRADILARRQKQIDYGKNTIGYDNYIKLIPRNKRSRDHPQTPPKEVKYSRRAFDGLVKIWRTKLHSFDPPNNDGNGTSDDHADCSSN